MISGSSALNNASNQVIVSPVIEVKLCNTYYYQGISFGGISFDTYTAFEVFGTNDPNEFADGIITVRLE